MATYGSPCPSEVAILEEDAAQLLAGVIAGTRTADASFLAELEPIATAAAKLAYGSGHPEWLSNQMGRVIAWCDHLDDEYCIKAFLVALKTSPLSSPSWHRA
jgi:hypothetical protein